MTVVQCARGMCSTHTCIHASMMSMWMMYRYSNRYSNFLIWVASVGLASARPNYICMYTVLYGGQFSWGANSWLFLWLVR